MNKKILILYILMMAIVPSANALVVDHNAVAQFDLYKNTTAFQNAIETAKSNFHIGYGHTSHGSQITSGMTGFNTFMNNLGYPTDLFKWSSGGTGDSLDLEEGDGYGSGWLDHDCGYSGWDTETRYYLNSNDPDEPYEDHSDVNMIMWSWCGQVDNVNIQTHYLDNMADLESEYPNVSFIYMTGHLEGRKTGDSWFDNNNAIRDVVSGTDRVLFDFADIEKYDPDQMTNYANYFADDNCDYDSDGTAPRNEDSNWAIDWQNSHTEGTDWYSVSCAHSQSLNCNQKAKAFWWMMAKLAGWNENTCENCADCSQKIQNANTGDIIKLTADIIDHDGTCIEFDGTDGVTFDCEGHTIDGVDSDSTTYGIYSQNNNDTVVHNCTITDWTNGIAYNESNSGHILNNKIYSNTDKGIILIQSIHNKIAFNEIYENDEVGLRLESFSGSNAINDNIITSNNIGISLAEDGASPNLIYNNYFSDNEFNTQDDGFNFWNTGIILPGPNIIGGQNISGNYFSDYYGVDSNGDGFGDTAYLVGGTGMNQDNFPLAIPEVPTIFLSIGMMFLSLVMGIKNSKLNVRF
ncbi:MAG: right-handed parallel beta-helix repeat-containing protein [Candidatus Aenigmarchaeota archaeon]|nr:right-handed parallel beta-helix repeat-containing protein [Candidatus Aenigmarchaeota archaeon]